MRLALILALADVDVPADSVIEPTPLASLSAQYVMLPPELDTVVEAF